MLNLGLPVATINNEAVMCIELIISNLPTETAWRALDQHCVTDNVNRQKLYHINWLSKKGAINHTNKSARQFTPPSVLEVSTDAVLFIDIDVVPQRLMGSIFGLTIVVMSLPRSK